MIYPFNPYWCILILEILKISGWMFIDKSLPLHFRQHLSLNFETCFSWFFLLLLLFWRRCFVFLFFIFFYSSGNYKGFLGNLMVLKEWFWGEFYNKKHAHTFNFVWVFDLTCKEMFRFQFLHRLHECIVLRVTKRIKW